MTGRCTRWERWLLGSGGGLKVLNRNLHSFQLLEIIQVLDSISWVRCASGNVFLKSPQWRICAVWDSVYAHTVLINDFNRVGSTFRQTWLCTNL